MKMWHTRSPPLVKMGFFAMGTEVTVTVAPGHRRRRDDAIAAIAEVERAVQEFGRQWWAWGSGGLARINADLAAGKTAEIPAAMRPLFARAWDVWQATGGLYEPRIAEIVRLWGFDNMARLRDMPPEPTDIDTLLAALRAAPPYDGGASYGPAPGVGWDFGGIGKGWIVDRTLESLATKGFTDAIVDAGGNLAVRGSRGDRPWRVGIRNPRSSPESPALLATLHAQDEAVNTHGDDQRFFEFKGLRYAHLINPATGWPAQGLRSLTVVHPDGALAEAAGAAMFVAGKDGWRALARRLCVDQVLAVTENGCLYVTPNLAGRIRSEHGVDVCLAY